MRTYEGLETYAENVTGFPKQWILAGECSMAQVLVAKYCHEQQYFCCVSKIDDGGKVETAGSGASASNVRCSLSDLGIKVPPPRLGFPSIAFLSLGSAGADYSKNKR